MNFLLDSYKLNSEQLTVRFNLKKYINKLLLGTNVQYF